MTLKAIEDGARAIQNADSDTDWDYEKMAKACIEAAIASGELVPASAVAAERELIAETMWRAELRRASGKERNVPWSEIAEADQERWLYLADAIRALEPASGEYVLVPRETLLNAQRYAWLRDKNACVLEECGSELDELCDDGMNRDSAAK